MAQSKLTVTYQGVDSAAKKIKHENGSEGNRGGATLELGGQEALQVVTLS